MYGGIMKLQWLFPHLLGRNLVGNRPTLPQCAVSEETTQLDVPVSTLRKMVCPNISPQNNLG